VNHRGVGFRRLAYVGARYGPRAWVRYSPTLFGIAFALALPHERKAVRRNLRLLRGKRGALEERFDVARTFVSYAHCLAESLAVERPDAQGASPVISGREHFDEIVSRGRGGIVVTAHTGAWDLIARWLGQEHSVDVMVVMQGESNEDARALQDGVRARAGLRVAHVGGHPLDALPLLSHLRRRGVVAVQLDRIGRAEASLAVQVGGEPFYVPEGPFRLASLCGAPVIPVFARRLGYFRYEVVVRPPIEVSRAADPSAIRVAAERATAEMATFLRENPTQWFHFSS
jgi:phosphatidylinositol dimannoside acyltransferase